VPRHLWLPNKLLATLTAHVAAVAAPAIFTAAAAACGPLALAFARVASIGARSCVATATGNPTFSASHPANYPLLGRSHLH